jgi:hypothetical protein
MAKLPTDHLQEADIAKVAPFLKIFSVATNTLPFEEGANLFPDTGGGIERITQFLATMSERLTSIVKFFMSLSQYFI